ncbi:MAG TPA: sigma-54 dependent transcriptional regulator [Acidobacteriaceae bacterium]|nr:sigma-54 dependent transcriptional regulator [Acidobacteriaceae bacterium]
MQTITNHEMGATVSRTAVLVSADASFRNRLAEILIDMRWKVREASGGAEALSYLEEAPSEALLLDFWLPDLEAGDFAEQLRIQYPNLDLICVNEAEEMVGKPRSARRPELLHAIRQAQESASSVWSGQSEIYPAPLQSMAPRGIRSPQAHGINPAGSFVHTRPVRVVATASEGSIACDSAEQIAEEIAALTDDSLGRPLTAASSHVQPIAALPGMVGSSREMQNLAHAVRLVAPHTTTVLIEGPTGTGKELVAHAIHRLSPRAGRPFIILNCAAIPEALLEAELFGHTRGAFTGAIQSRTGRMEAAHGGTLFLDEIGEMPMALQAKVLRFLEAGELQRIGENEPVRVDVRVVAATHQPLQQSVEEGKFRSDLYFRLAVFPVQTPSLAERIGDIPELATYFLEKLGQTGPSKTFHPEAIEKLCGHPWPGNVRELGHVVERAYILAEDRPTITAAEIRMRSRERTPTERKV